MLEHRVMPILTIMNNGLYRTVKFCKPKYIGDPINAVKIFNDKEVDELILLDISDDRKWDDNKVSYYREISEEAFMPLCFGGRISSIDHAKRIFDAGFEKVSLNSAAVENPRLISDIANHYGVQSVVVSIDINTNVFGSARVYTNLGRKRTHLKAVEFAKQAESMGAGELLVTSVKNDGCMCGYNLECIKEVSDNVKIPVIANGGAGSIDDLIDGVTKAKAHSVAAGSYFVLNGPHRAVLISYLSRDEVIKITEISNEMGV